MSVFHNLFSWETRTFEDKKCIFKNCTLLVNIAGKVKSNKIDMIVQDYIQDILIFKTFGGVIHVPFRVTCPSLTVEKDKYPDRVTQHIVERLDVLEMRQRTESVGSNI